MKNNRIIEALNLHKPELEFLMSQFGYSENDAKFAQDEWICPPKVGSLAIDYDDELLDLLYNFDVSFLIILDFAFESFPYEHPRGLVIGYWEGDFLIIDKDTGEIIRVLLDESLDGDVKLAPNSRSFVEVLLRLIEFQKPPLPNENHEQKRVELIADLRTILGDGEYLEYYQDNWGY